MTALSRQNTLFVSEDWIKIYEALENVDFRAYDMENLTQALMTYLRVNYPDEFNDWIASSEFVTKIEILAWLSQNIAFRVDLNTRENFLSVAERRDSLIKLANFISYKIDRVRGSSGEVKIQAIKTTEPLIDSNNINLQDRTISWNDADDEDWYERFILIMNSAFSNRTKFGRPLVRHDSSGNQSAQLYRFDSVAPITGTYSFNANVNGVTLPFDIYNCSLDKTTGVVSELPPDGFNSLHILYRSDGRGLASPNTGFFMPIKQGNLSYQDETFTDRRIIRTLSLNSSNINNDDFFVQELSTNGEVLETWTRTDNIFGEGIFFTTIINENKSVYEVDTLPNDKVRVRFGDGTFGKIPVGTFRFWYRTSNPEPINVPPESITEKTVMIPYVSNNQVYFLTMTYSLVNPLTNAARSETNFDIRTRANKVYYTQNRMITGQDYNNFFLRDNAIRKVKTVNRTYSGHSRYTKLHDPTGLYENVKVVAEDGRLYEEFTSNVQDVTAEVTRLSHGNLVIQHLSPLLMKEDKALLYYNRYLEIPVSSNLRWKNTSIINGQSRGNIIRNLTPQPVGSTATDNLIHIGADAIVRFDGLEGPIFGVERVVDDGTAPNGIILDRTVPENANLVSVFPAFRTAFTISEIETLQTHLDNRLDFGLTWNHANQAWEVIIFNNLDKDGEFSLEYQGDTSGMNRDASWMIYLEYRTGEDENFWRIVDRGLGIYFESAREVDFYFANNINVVDPVTGRVVRDRIRLLASNESRDSLRRRGISYDDSSGCAPTVYRFVGDGSTSCFKTMELGVDETRVRVSVNGILLFHGVDWTIDNEFDGARICILRNAPEVGDVIELSFGESNVNATIIVKHFVGDGVTNQFDLEIDDSVTATNMRVFVDGVFQDPNIDYGVGNIGFNYTMVMGAAPPPGVGITAYAITGIDNSVFRRSRYTGDGLQTEFLVPVGNQSDDTLFVIIDGVMQHPDTYTISSSLNSTIVSFGEAPGGDTKVIITAIAVPEATRSSMSTFVTNGTQNNFTLNDHNGLSDEHVIVFLDGVMQEGRYSNNPVYYITGGKTVQFYNPPIEGLEMIVFVVQGTLGSLADSHTTDPTTGNRGDISESSCAISYLGKEIDFNCVDVIRHADGYVNVNGIFVAPPNANNRNFYDDPFLFNKLVIKNKLTDLVLWRKITEHGFTVYDPISVVTTPKGTYGASNNKGIKLGDTVDETQYRTGDIHFDVTTSKWLVANLVSGVWELASDQSAYKWAIGRDNLKFIWEHYSPDTNRINPSVSNIMDTYLLTTTFDDAYRNWLFSNNRIPANEPIPPTSESLRIQFQEFEEYKALSDTIIYHPARYKPLFGSNAVSELQAIFKVIQTPGSTISENDLKLRILNVINDYFSVNKWSFGETLYFTELATYVHASLAPDIQSFVIIPKNNAQAFGRLFQIRSEPDELFISSATVDDIQVVTSLSDDELRMGTLI